VRERGLASKDESNVKLARLPAKECRQGKHAQEGCQWQAEIGMPITEKKSAAPRKVRERKKRGKRCTAASPLRAESRGRAIGTLGRSDLNDKDCRRRGEKGKRKKRKTKKGKRDTREGFHDVRAWSASHTGGKTVDGRTAVVR